MNNYAIVTKGPWRIRPSGVAENQAAVSYVIGDKSQVVAVEMHADLAQLRDAITEYLSAVDGSR